MISLIFSTKWKRIYEEHREEIETLGYDEWISTPFGIMDLKMSAKYCKAINEETKSFIKDSQ